MKKVNRLKMLPKEKIETRKFSIGKETVILAVETVFSHPENVHS